MFPEMRRKKQQLGLEETEQILLRGTSGVLSVYGPEGYPYGVPLSYVYRDGKLYFHCAKKGTKLSCIEKNAKASFTVIDLDRVVPEEYTSYFRSVMAFGTIRILEQDPEKWSAMEALGRKYYPGDTQEGLEQAIRREWAPLTVMEMEIDHMTGKEAIELVREKRGEKASVSV